MKKRLVAALLASTMVLGSLAGCGSSSKDDSAKTDETTETEATDEVGTDDAETAGEAEAHGPSSEAAPAWEAYDELIANIKAETDLEKREAMMHEAEDMLMDTWAVIPLYYYNDSYMQNTDVDGIYANLFGFKYFEIGRASCRERV